MTLVIFRNFLATKVATTNYRSIRKEELFMKQVTTLFMLIIGMLFLFTGLLNAQYQMENLGRGLIAVKMDNVGVYVGWRILHDRG